jgi:hypothetical protein
MKAEEFIKAHRAEYNTCNAIYSSYHYDAMEQFANQRVIEELEYLRNNYTDGFNKIDVSRCNDRIKELKTRGISS